MATHPVDGEVADADVPSRLEQPVGVLQHVPPVWDHGDRVGDANNVAGARGRKTLQVGVGGVAKNDVDLGGGCKGGEGHGDKGTEEEGGERVVRLGGPAGVSVAGDGPMLTLPPQLLSSTLFLATLTRLGVRSTTWTLLNQSVITLFPKNSTLLAVPPPRSTHTQPFFTGMFIIRGFLPCSILCRYWSYRWA